MDRKSGHEHYNRLPDSVLMDGGVTPAARCVYAFLAGCVHQGTVARVGQRRIAVRLHFSRSTVEAALAQLEEAGHVKSVGVARSRGMYHLTSNIFGQKQRAGVEELISAPRKRLASVRVEKSA